MFNSQSINGIGNFPAIPEAIQLFNLPEPIQNARSIVLYKLATRVDEDGVLKTKSDGSLKLDKIPVNKQGHDASYNNGDIYLPLDEAIELISVESNKEINQRRYHGVGLSLKNCDVDNFLAIDVDNCVNPDGSFNETARYLIDNIEGYVEKSVSGTGIHIYTRAQGITSNIKNHECGVEVFRNNLFITLSGDVVEDRDTFPDSPVDISALSRFIKTPSNQLTAPASFEIAAKKDYNLTIEKASQILLEELEPDSARDFWLKIGMALHFNFDGSEEAFDLWREYSHREGAGVPASEGDLRKQWNSLKLNHPNPVTFASVIAQVRKAAMLSDGQQYGDLYNGEVFAEMYRGKLLYVRAKGRGTWLQFDGIVWNWCGSGEEEVAAKQAAKEIMRRAGEAVKQMSGSQDMRSVFNNAKVIRNVNKQKDMLQSAASEDGMYVSLFELDTDPYLLAARNGVIDLQTGRLIEAQPQMLLTRQVQANFNPNALCPLWDKFMLETFCGNAESVHYMQKVFGYMLTGDVSAEKWWIWTGEGSNGKSVIANVLTKLLGDNAVTANSKLLMRQDLESNNTNDVAALQGSRLVLANETKTGKALDEELVKSLVGTERISARFLHKEFFSFYPTFKIVLRTNSPPKINDDTNGVWRRTVLVKFENDVAEEDQDLELFDKLMTEKEGILAWMVRGCLLYQQEGIKQTPAKITQDTLAYRYENDKMRGFLEECCDLEDKEAKTPESTVYSQFQKWCRDCGVNSFSKNRFTQTLFKRGVTQGWTVNPYDKKKLRAYVGIKPKEDSEWFF